MSVLRLTRFLAENGWEVDLVLTTGGGSMEPRIDTRVKVHHLRDFSAGARYSRAKGLRKAIFAVTDLIPYAFTRVQEKARSRAFRNHEYDAAIISLQGLSAAFCCTKVNAKRRIQWIRSDLSSCDPEGKVMRNIRAWAGSIDYYACVSGSTKDSFDNLFPDLVPRSVLVYNVIDATQMRLAVEEAKDPYTSFGHGLKVVTVCRLLDKAKGLFRMLAVHQRLLAEGIEHRWFVVGDGPDRDMLKAAIDKAGVAGSFVLMGSQADPFPYYRYADVSASVSYYEGLCGTVNEAKIAGKPVVATLVSGIQEQIVDGEGGLIVQNDEEAIFQGMRRILTDPDLRQRLANTELAPAVANDDLKLKLLYDLVMGDKA